MRLEHRDNIMLVIKIGDNDIFFWAEASMALYSTDA